MNAASKPVARGHGIKIRVACALFILVAVQGLILLCSISITGVIDKNNTATYNILSNQAAGMSNDLKNVMNTKRKNITNAALELNSKIQEILEENGMPLKALSTNETVTREILDEALARLIAFTKFNSVTGAFIVLDASPDVASEAVEARKSVYIRDSSPDLISGNNSNLLLEYGYVDMARGEGIGVDSLWTRDMIFEDKYSRDFYYNPVRAALSGGADYMTPQDYGYWSVPFSLRAGDLSIVTYTLPLISGDGTVYGIMGFELDTHYISNLLKATSIPYDRGFYVLGMDDGEGIYNNSVVFSGPYANQFLSGGSEALVAELIYESGQSDVCKIYNPNVPDMKAIGAYSEVRLYEVYSQFYNERWTLICMAPEDSVMEGSTNIRNSIIISIISTVCLALILAAFVTLYISAPINRLSREISSINPEKTVRFERTNIREINELKGALETLSDGVSEAAGKMFKIVELVDMPLGSFEINHRDGVVRLSQSLYRLLNLTPPADGSFNISITLWNGIINSMECEYSNKNADGITEMLMSSVRIWEAKRWFRMRFASENTRDIGVIIDVTDEIMQKQRLEFERNYDSLTKLLGRQAFVNKASSLVKAAPDKAGVMLFADIDDLKYVNDMYGHEIGDAYIKKFAGFLNKFSEKGAAVGRLSGDEFAMFMGGFKSNAEARTAFDNVLSDLKNLAISLPDGLTHKLRASIGLSYYPSDSDNIDELIKYADYAMYEIKHSAKGEIREFNIGDYNKNSFVIKMKSMLEILINEKRIGFSFQPIADVRTGEVFAYEALMRPMIREFKTPTEILNAARANSKLYQVEHLVFDLVLNWVAENARKIKGKKIFINSIPGQRLTDADMNAIMEKYGSVSDSVVFEIAEAEFSGEGDVVKKVDMFRQFGAELAIDDYGAGYSSELVFLQISPEYLKIDMSIVRDIDKDEGKQRLVQNVVAYALKRKLKVIAEGVETFEEMNKLIAYGVDYMQGYYFGKPGFELAGIPDDIKNKLIEAGRSRDVSARDGAPEPL